MDIDTEWLTKCGQSKLLHNLSGVEVVKGDQPVQNLTFTCY